MASSEILESSTMSSTPLCLTLWLCQWKRSLLPCEERPRPLHQGHHPRRGRVDLAPAPPELLADVTGPQRSRGSETGPFGATRGVPAALEAALAHRSGSLERRSLRVRSYPQPCSKG